MTPLIEGLGLLLRDNARRREPLEQQARYWMALREQDIEEELNLLAEAKKRWFYASVFLWQVIAIVACGIVADALWSRSFHLTFLGVVQILATWGSTLFLTWLVASLFDKHAGFERWFAAFQSRAPLSAESDSAEAVADALQLARIYPEVLRYEQGVLSHRALRHEDVHIMRAMGAALRHRDLTRELTAMAQPGGFQPPATAATAGQPRIQPGMQPA
ncbi:hypothetical protein PY257_08235 [Ramlibacter sp. H39-3-26]|uniref:hypothetical protein n=1 Tax=Curvibacter soli TaxID=3031331 RepID=UPI0023DB998F|nr:hypothetical protein [Ramlibacter sp. H39-3-26]MDF1485167.1 hypothetical protein [Ramlibacter sp. H39-3-26]